MWKVTVLLPKGNDVQTFNSFEEAKTYGGITGYAFVLKKV